MSANSRHRVLFVATHPVHYAAPIFRRMAADPRLDMQVAYLSLAGATPSHDAGFGTTIQWDVPLLDGYPWIELQRPQARSLRSLLDTGRWDAVVLYTGYRHRLFWSAVLHAKRRGVPVLFGTDATNYATLGDANSSYKAVLKRMVLPWIFRLATVAIVPSSRSRQFLLGMGLRPDRVVVTPYVVDNDWWKGKAVTIDRDSIRAGWKVPFDATVFLFCAKLQPWKRPHDLLEAFARLGRSDTFLVFAGEGPLRADLERSAEALGVSARVRFLGFANQTALPGIYRATDIFVLPSEYEAFGVVVNEAMLCGCVPIISDRVGAGGDLVAEGKTGLTYQTGDVDRLASAMGSLTADVALRERLRQGGEARIAAWSPALNIDRLVEATQLAALAGGRQRGSGLS
jgi:glycosyltransferase involved in cell wall biosynthesis